MAELLQQPPPTAAGSAPQPASQHAFVQPAAGCQLGAAYACPWALTFRLALGAPPGAGSTHQLRVFARLLPAEGSSVPMVMTATLQLAPVPWVVGPR